MRVLSVNIRLGIDKITGPQQLHLIKQTDFIGIVKARINHSHLHAHPHKSGCMKAISPMNGYLSESRPIIQTVQFHRILHFFFSGSITWRDAVGFGPYFSCRHDKWQSPQTFGQQRIIQRYQCRIVPFAGSYNRCAYLFNRFQISSTHRQVCTVYRQLLTVAAFYRSYTQELLGTVDGIFRIRLVFKSHPIFIGLLRLHGQG